MSIAILNENDEYISTVIILLCDVNDNRTSEKHDYDLRVVKSKSIYMMKYCL